MTFEYTNIRNAQGNPAEYLISGLPWITSSWAMSASWARVDFPYVTQRLYIRNNGPGYLNYGFTKNGLYTGNYGRLEPSGSVEYRMRLKTLYFLGATVNTEYQLAASLTTVLWTDFPVLTGSAVYPNSTPSGCFGYARQGDYMSGSGLG